MGVEEGIWEDGSSGAGEVFRPRVVISIDLRSAPSELVKGLRDLVTAYPTLLVDTWGKDFVAQSALEGSTVQAVFRREGRPHAEGGAWSITSTKKGDGLVEVAYARECDAFRGLGRLMAAASAPEGGGIPNLEFRDEAWHETLGAMVDASRGAVPLPGAMAATFRRLALAYVQDYVSLSGKRVWAGGRELNARQVFTAVEDVLMGRLS